MGLKKVLVRDSAGQYEETLSSVKRDTFIIDWEKNQTNQVTFDAVADGSLAYSLLQNENSIIFDGQEYVIKQTQEKFASQISTMSVTATAVGYECSRVWQHNIQSGTKAYRVEDVLHYYFDNNTEDFTWEVQGSFGTAEIENLGNGSGKDCIDKIVSSFDAVFTSDNRHLILSTPEAFNIKVDKGYKYGHDTSDVSVQIDTTSIQNIAWCYGKTKEQTADDNGNTSNDPEYYFDPFIVKDEDSIKRWGERPGADISDERFTDVNSMKSYALSKMQTQPLTVMNLTYFGNTEVKPGEVWFLEIKSNDFITDAQVDGIKTYPLINKAPEITLDNSYQTLYDYDIAVQKRLNQAVTDVQNISKSVSDNAMLGTITQKVGDSVVNIPD